MDSPDLGLLPDFESRFSPHFALASMCHYQNFFGSDESASKYISENPRVFVVKPSDVFDAMKRALTPYRDAWD